MSVAAHEVMGHSGPVSDIKRGIRDVPLWGWGAMGLGVLGYLYIRSRNKATAAASGTVMGPLTPQPVDPTQVSDPTGGMSGFVDTMQNQWTQTTQQLQTEQDQISAIQDQNAQLFQQIAAWQAAQTAGQGGDMPPPDVPPSGTPNDPLSVGNTLPVLGGSVVPGPVGSGNTPIPIGAPAPSPVPSIGLPPPPPVRPQVAVQNVIQAVAPVLRRPPVHHDVPIPFRAPRGRGPFAE